MTQLGGVPYWYEVELPDGTRGWTAKAYPRIATATGSTDFSNLPIHFSDVGNGDAVLIDHGDREIVIDGGDSLSILWEYANELIQDPIELLVMTHSDTDHWRGFKRLLGLETAPRTPTFSVVEFWEPGYDRSCRPLASSDEPMRGIQAKTQRVRRPLEVTRVPLTRQAAPSASGVIRVPELPGFQFLLLHTTATPTGRDCAYRINNASIVLKVLFGPHTILFTGDANGKDRDGPDQPSDMEFDLLALESRAPGILRAEVIKVPHHGSETASTSAFLAKVQPRLAIIQASTRHHPPRETAVERYVAAGAITLRTDEDRRANNHHIICYLETDSTLNCNYADLLDGALCEAG